MLTGKHLIAGEWIASQDKFSNEPVTGAADEFPVGTAELVDQAARAADAAFESYGRSTAGERAAFLRTISADLDIRRADIVQMGCRETGLPEARLDGELNRTIGQLNLFTDHIENGEHLDYRHDPALPDRLPLPRPDLKLIQRPIGPVAVFGASNFPLAFSTAGGDTAAALAAGCPVVAKGHSAHPGTADIVSQAIDAAISANGLHPGVFSQIQGGNRAVGQAVVRHPLICAVGFTGSLSGGRALFDLCAARPDPIPFFGELGSVNPMFLLPSAVASRGDDIASGWAVSLSMGAGQFCTKPGIAIVVEGPYADRFASASVKALRNIPTQTMLTDGIARSYCAGRDRIAKAANVGPLLTAPCGQRQAMPQLFQTSGDEWLENSVLGEEVFGPLGLIVIARDSAQMLDLARSLEGQLTCTIHMDDADQDISRKLMSVLERKAGRILANSFPTGVEVCDSMVHGGPYPASTNFGATSVGTMAIRRFLRPVCFQNVPDYLLPK